MSCDDDDPTIPNPEELITTFRYSLTPEMGGETVTLSLVDLDGDGGEAPVITGGTLLANTLYTGTIEVLNESVSPVDDITLEVREEDEDHQFFFESTIEDTSVSYEDLDENGNPLGISTMLTTGDAGSGILTVTLRHMPDKFAAGVSDGDKDNAGGDTDIEAVIPFDVQ